MMKINDKLITISKGGDHKIIPISSIIEVSLIEVTGMTVLVVSNSKTDYRHAGDVSYFHNGEVKTISEIEAFGVIKKMLEEI